MIKKLAITICVLVTMIIPGTVLTGCEGIGIAVTPWDVRIDGEYLRWETTGGGITPGGGHMTRIHHVRAQMPGLTLYTQVTMGTSINLRDPFWGWHRERSEITWGAGGWENLPIDQDVIFSVWAHETIYRPRQHTLYRESSWSEAVIWTEEQRQLPVPEITSMSGDTLWWISTGSGSWRTYAIRAKINGNSFYSIQFGWGLSGTNLWATSWWDSPTWGSNWILLPPGNAEVSIRSQDELHQEIIRTSNWSEPVIWER